VTEECVLSSLDLMLTLAIKLKMPLHPVKDTLRMLIIKFTPLDPAIRRTYTAQGLIIDLDRKYNDSEVKIYTEELM